ncbi:peptide chain release factor-like protein [Candidatus Peregrinibacteria bacterium]|nr:peptide chain release factor-like protein [Candidatus Peregrinibacteria bacterium]
MKEFPVELPDYLMKIAEELEIFPSDISEKFVRGSGSGGQKINKTSSCVLLRHSPTGIEVKCQKHREQNKNRITAYKLLIKKIEERFKGFLSLEAQRKYKIKKQKKRRSKKAKEKMLKEKHQRSEIKAMRKPIKGDD